MLGFKSRSLWFLAPVHDQQADSDTTVKDKGRPQSNMEPVNYCHSGKLMLPYLCGTFKYASDTLLR